MNASAEEAEPMPAGMQFTGLAYATLTRRFIADELSPAQVGRTAVVIVVVGVV